MKWAAMALLSAVAALTVAAVSADEMSGDDKLRMLYSHRFVFTREGLPLLTVKLMDGQREVRLSAPSGLVVLPDGEGGPEVRAGASFRVTVHGARPARMRFWVIVERKATEADVATWRARGYETQTFETGVVFGVEGDVIDSRELFLGVAPEATEPAARRAAEAIARKWGVQTFVHPEMVERPHGTLVARDDRSGIEVRNDGILWFAPAAEKELVTVADVVHGGGGSQLLAEKRETRRYFGKVYVALGHDGNLTVVNAVPEDRLLMGLVPSEIFPDAHPEALKAQAVAARDELLSRIGTRHFAEPYLLCATQHCQVYGGAGREDPRTTAAVAATRGEVLLRDGGGGLVPVYYSASCGGHGEHNENVWSTPPDPSLRGRLDAPPASRKALAAFAGGVNEANVAAFLALAPELSFCGRTRYAKDRYRWRVELDALELDRLVAAELPHVGPVVDLDPLERGVSGRVRTLRIRGRRGEAVVTGELRIRRLLGGLKSSLFVARAKTEGEASDRIVSWIIEGAGFGHGVGMCQTGAIGMAEAGYDYRKILQHYYPGSHVRKLY